MTLLAQIARRPADSKHHHAQDARPDLHVKAINTMTITRLALFIGPPLEYSMHEPTWGFTAMLRT